MTERTHRPARLFAAAMLLPALVLVGCGSGPDVPEDAGAAPQTPEPAASSSPSVEEASSSPSPSPTPEASDAAGTSPPSPSPEPGRAADDDGTSLAEAIATLDVAAETEAGYDRDLFEHWVDADGDCLDTRDEVLREESRFAVDGGECDVMTGDWHSYYDGLAATSDDDLDIDHVVSAPDTQRRA